MQPTPRFLGALAAGLVAAVAGGAVIGTVPPMKQRGWAQSLPEPDEWQIVRTQPDHDYPDQYPIVTPEGRFEVAELSSRGLYRTARYAAHYAYDDAYVYVPEPGYPDPGGPDPAAPPEVAGEPGGASAIPAVASPPEPASPPAAPAVASAGPRIIDVAAELAALQ
jgi:hypothetical protein